MCQHAVYLTKEVWDGDLRISVLENELRFCGTETMAMAMAMEMMALLSLA
eukprot:COSAG02_NODE_1162_length_14168_cov_10.478570_9_plen_50_part_00